MHFFLLFPCKASKDINLVKRECTTFTRVLFMIIFVSLLSYTHKNLYCQKIALYRYVFAKLVHMHLCKHVPKISFIRFTASRRASDAKELNDTNYSLASLNTQNQRKWRSLNTQFLFKINLFDKFRSLFLLHNKKFYASTFA